MRCVGGAYPLLARWLVVTGVGDPGDEQAVRMVDEVVPGERVDEFALAAPVRAGDGDELTVARRRRNALRPGQEPVAVGGEQRRRNEDQRVVARARRGEDRGDRRVVAHHEPAEQLPWVCWWHGATIPGRPDAALTAR